VSRTSAYFEQARGRSHAPVWIQVSYVRERGRGIAEVRRTRGV